jgi:uncharacterized protein
MKVPLLHLENGLHQFEGSIQGSSLNFAENKIYSDNIHVDVEFNKYEKNLKCSIEIDTIAHYNCDRCLESYSLPFNEGFELLFHIGSNDFETDEDDVVFIAPEKAEIDLTDWIIEYLILSLPMKNLCREDCKGICAGCGVELNYENCRCDKETIDPRLEKLRDLLE